MRNQEFLLKAEGRKQAQLDSLKAARANILEEFNTANTGNAQLDATLKEIANNPVVDNVSRLYSDDIFTTMGGRVPTPEADAFVRNALQYLVPDMGTSQQANDAASGLASAFKDIDPAFLAAAAGAGGLGIGLMAG